MVVVQVPRIGVSPNCKGRQSIDSRRCIDDFLSSVSSSLAPSVLYLYAIIPSLQLNSLYDSINLQLTLYVYMNTNIHTVSQTAAAATTTTATTTTIVLPFVWDYLDEPVLEETFTQSYLS